MNERLNEWLCSGSGWGEGGWVVGEGEVRFAGLGVCTTMSDAHWRAPSLTKGSQPSVLGATVFLTIPREAIIRIRGLHGPGLQHNTMCR